MTAPEPTSALLLELSLSSAVLERLPGTRWSQPCPCSLSCSVLLEAEAAAVAAGQRQLWLLIHPRAQQWHWEGPSLLPVQMGSSSTQCGHLCVHRPATSVPGLPVLECLGDLPPNSTKNCCQWVLEKIVQSSVTVHENIGVLPLSPDFILLNDCVSSVACLFDQHPGLLCECEDVKLQAWIGALFSTNIPM